MKAFYMKLLILRIRFWSKLTITRYSNIAVNRKFSYIDSLAHNESNLVKQGES